MKAGEQNGRFYLGTRNRHCERDGRKGAAGNPQGKEIILARLELCAELTERLHDALHRTPGQRFVADKSRLEGKSSQNSRHHANGRTGISGIQILPWRLQSLESSTFYDHSR